MTQRFDVDLDSERLHFDDQWLTEDELSGRVTQALASKNFGAVGRLGEALEQLGQALAGAQSLTIKLSGDQYAKIEAAGAKLGISAALFARDLLAQVLAGAPAAAPVPVAVAVAPPPPAFAPPVVTAAPAPIFAPPPVVESSDVSPEEAAQALTITPKRRDAPPPVVAAPPVMTPVAQPGPQPSVVVDLGPDDPSKQKPTGAGADGRRWFNRS